MQTKNLWLRGALIGLFVPLFLFGIFLILTGFNVEFGRHPLAGLIIIALAILEMPVAIIGRSLGLPIETGGAAFLLYQFNALGYILTIVFWVSAGAFLGWLVDKRYRG
ncbi:MAG: hypothetical protein Q8O22_03185 [Candidatus Omnitrophota bacterium]|nr:hypothetical protein [Candidatus Omnitrophota bacterium]